MELYLIPVILVNSEEFLMENVSYSKQDKAVTLIIIIFI